MSSSTEFDLLQSPAADSANDSNNNLQPFFVLHKAQPQQKPVPKSPRSRKGRRKIGSPEKYESNQYEISVDEQLQELRLETFRLVWSKIENGVKESLREISLNLCKNVHQWIQESLLDIKSCNPEVVSEIQKPYPLIKESICRRIPTAFILTQNVEFVDDQRMFEEVGDYLRSYGCHVANLSALNFSGTYGIAGCVRSLLRIFLHEAQDTADIAVLSSWYSEPKNYGHPVIVIIDDMEQCEGSVLSDFIIMLSEWIVKVPIVFVMGIMTTVDTPRKMLKSDALQHLLPCKFSAPSRCDRMNAIVESALVRSFFGFGISHKVAVFLKSHFQKQDGTIVSFVRALKIACIKHFLKEPLSFLCEGMLYEDSETFWHKKYEMLPQSLLTQASDFPSCQRVKLLNHGCDTLPKALSQLRRLQSIWSSVVMCLFEVAKFKKMHFLDIYCEATDPTLFNSSHLESKTWTNHKELQGTFDFVKGGSIAQAIQKTRELPLTSLQALFDIWRVHTETIAEIQEKIEQVHVSKASSGSNKILRGTLANTHKSKSHNAGMLSQSVNDKAAVLLENMVRKFLVPVECAPYHEVVCFKHVEALQTAVVGDPRKTVQNDLLKAACHLECSCCSSKNSLSPSMHDTSILYNLAQGHGDLINLHDWYQSFKGALRPRTHTKRKVRSPASKKVKAASQESEATIQARFCRSVMELQITGLLRMPSKRRPDFVQSVTFGI